MTLLFDSYKDQRGLIRQWLYAYFCLVALRHVSGLAVISKHSEVRGEELAKRLKRVESRPIKSQQGSPKASWLHGPDKGRAAHRYLVVNTCSSLLSLLDFRNNSLFCFTFTLRFVCHLSLIILLVCCFPFRVPGRFCSCYFLSWCYGSDCRRRASELDLVQVRWCFSYIDSLWVSDSSCLLLEAYLGAYAPGLVPLEGWSFRWSSDFLFVSFVKFSFPFSSASVLFSFYLFITIFL